MTIELTNEEFDTLLLMCGYAAGAAFGHENKPLAYSFIAIANAVNRGNPRWRAYEMPEKEPGA
jgi:hypothetical protein